MTARHEEELIEGANVIELKMDDMKTYIKRKNLK